MHNSKATLALLAVLFVWHVAGYAEIYKYQDENGRWHFSDQPPKSSGTKYGVSRPGGSDKKSFSSDYQKSLNEKYKPGSPVESATLAVVTIKTHIGSGSGFFVTEDCMIVTNKHVVRPTKTSNWKESEEEFKEEESAIDKEEEFIADEEERLEIVKKELAEYRNYIDSLRPGGLKNNKEADYEYRLRTYKRDVQYLEDKIREIEKRKEKYKQSHSSFSMDSSIADVARTFNVVLKDDTDLQARLVELDKKEDLALLRVDQCKSPFLVLKQSVQPYQGMKIFAIGSPLGLKDHVTSGIVTNTDNNRIKIDSQVLPGNSGGPLITEDGDVIGVNTLKVSADNPNSEGFGVAIPSNVVLQKFGRYINY